MILQHVTQASEECHAAVNGESMNLIEQEANEAAQLEFYMRLTDQYVHCTHLETSRFEEIQAMRREEIMRQNGEYYWS